MLDIETLEMVRDSARRFTDTKTDHAALRAGRNILPWKDAPLLAEMAELGWFAMLVPAEEGGLGLDLSAAAEIVRELGRGLLGEAIVPLGVLAPLTVLRSDNSLLRRELLE